MPHTYVDNVSQAESIDQLVDMLGPEALALIKAALVAQEKQRVYHKTAYLKRQVRDRKVREFLAAKGIDLSSL